MKTERVTLLTSPEFKTFLSTEAKRENVSVAELVRSRCERRPTEDEAVLVALTSELRSAVVRAKKSLREGLAEADSVLSELRAKHVKVPAARPLRGAKARLAA
ncbi:MAG: hypothetical protein ABL900_05450 [Burkholderiaceae bacterium]